MANQCNIAKQIYLLSIKKKNYMRSFLLLTFLSLFLMGGSEAYGKKASGPEALLKEADARRTSLYRSTKKMKFRHNWMNCINIYEEIYNRFPKSDQAPWGLYKVGRLYTKLYGYSGMEKDLDSAIETYRKLVKAYARGGQ